MKQSLVGKGLALLVLTFLGVQILVIPAYLYRQVKIVTDVSLPRLQSSFSHDLVSFL